MRLVVSGRRGVPGDSSVLDGLGRDLARSAEGDLGAKAGRAGGVATEGTVARLPGGVETPASAFPLKRSSKLTFGLSDESATGLSTFDDAGEESVGESVVIS